MILHSTNNHDYKCSLQEAVIQGIAADRGLFMPDSFVPIENSFFSEIRNLSFQEIAFTVASHLLQGEIPQSDLKNIIDKAYDFDAPLTGLTDKIYSLELFHGPTLAFKDFGARFMAGLMSYFTADSDQKITIITATSGDTGSAVANSFLGSEKIDIVILYPSSKVSYIQEKQLTTLGQNIRALEVKGTFDDCQQMAKSAFHDKELTSLMKLSSANSINIARLIPQSFYYFYAYSRLPDRLYGKEAVFSVPSGNFGNLTAGLFAKKLGLPVKKFVAATNINNTVPLFLESGIYKPMPSRETISNAMDVGNPNNFARMNELFGSKAESFRKEIHGCYFTDQQTRLAIQELFREFKYIADPHGAVAYLGLKDYLNKYPEEDSAAIFLETAHPAKFIDVVEDEIKQKVAIPERLKACLERQKSSVLIDNKFEDLKKFLLAGK